MKVTKGSVATYHTAIISDMNTINSFYRGKEMKINIGALTNSSSSTSTSSDGDSSSLSSDDDDSSSLYSNEKNSWKKFNLDVNITFIHRLPREWPE